MTGSIPVLAAGVGVRQGSAWVLRAASFRLSWAADGRPAVGIVSTAPGPGSAVVELLAGSLQPAHGELRVLGQDLTTPEGRAAVRRLVGVARRSGRGCPGARVRSLVARQARRTRLPRGDRDLMTAAVLDRLGLTPWAQVPVRATPAGVLRRVRLAAAAVHEPELLLLDGLFDGLPPAELTLLADSVRDFARDTAIVVTGCDATVLRRACDEVLTLADGVLVAA